MKLKSTDVYKDVYFRIFMYYYEYYLICKRGLIHEAYR